MAPEKSYATEGLGGYSSSCAPQDSTGLRIRGGTTPLVLNICSRWKWVNLSVNMAIILNIVYHLGSFFQHNSWGSWSISAIGYEEGRVLCQFGLLETDFICTFVLTYRRQEIGEIAAKTFHFFLAYPFTIQHSQDLLFNTFPPCLKTRAIKQDLPVNQSLPLS